MSQGQTFRAEAVTSQMNKACSKCLADKALSDFGIDRAARDGLRYICKACSNALSKAYSAANKDALKERANKRLIEDPGAGARHSLKWRQTHPERAKASNLRYGAENKAKIAAKDAKKYAKDPAKAARQYAKWVAKTPNLCVSGLQTVEPERREPEGVIPERTSLNCWCFKSRGALPASAT